MDWKRPWLLLHHDKKQEVTSQLLNGCFTSTASVIAREYFLGKVELVLKEIKDNVVKSRNNSIESQGQKLLKVLRTSTESTDVSATK